MMKVHTRIKNNQQYKKYGTEAKQMSPCRIFCSKYKENTMKGNELDCKPGYVESDHLSRIYVTIKLKQPTWNAAGNCIIPQAPLQKLYLVLLRMGFTEPVMLPWQR